MKYLVFLKPLDFGAIGLTLSTIILSLVFVYTGTGGPERVLVKGAREKWVFPQEGTEIITVPGPLGDTEVELRDRMVRIRSSPCNNQTCVAAGVIQSPGQWLACLPNRVLVSIEGKVPSGKKDDELDASAW